MSECHYFGIPHRPPFIGSSTREDTYYMSINVYYRTIQIYSSKLLIIYYIIFINRTILIKGEGKGELLILW